MYEIRYFKKDTGLQDVEKVSGTYSSKQRKQL